MSLAAKSKQENSMVSSSSRPLQLRMRPDVTAQQQKYQGRDYWVVKDPLTLKYYRFEEEEYALLNMLDGVSSPDQIKRRFDYEFAPQKISLQELFQFVGMLYRNSLLVSDGANQGVELKKRGERNRKQQFKSSLTNVLSIRFRGFDPDQILTVINGWTWWFFTWPCFFLVLLFSGTAAGLLFANFELFQSKLPSFQEFFASKNWLWLAVIMGATKVLHEFGHGLACKRFGSQCHEMGVMLLVLTPCLYCNVSDSWTLPSKWKRAFIAAAGMYVELVLASAAVFVWWFSQPGLVNQLALNMIFVCSVSTLLFNANPLLRYDGYYILSDLMEIPNLRQKASAVLQRLAGQWMLGIEARHDPFLPVRRKWFFVFYAIAAVLYRWFITFAIFWFLYGLLEPYGLKILGQLIALTAIYGLLGMPLIKLWKFFSVPGRMGTVKPVYATVSAFVLGVIAVGIMMFPIPRYVYCSFYVEPANSQTVYVDVPGELKAIHVAPNQRVVEGQVLVELESHEIEADLKKIDDESKIFRIRQASYQRAAQTNVEESKNAGDMLESLQTQLVSNERKLAQRSKDLEHLTILAPATGILLPPAPVEPAEGAGTEALSGWTGTPLEKRNLGAYLDQKTLIGAIVPDLQNVEAHLAIDQEEIEFIREGLRVELLLEHLPGKIVQSKTSSISPTKMEVVPKQLSSRFGGALVTTYDQEKGDIPQSTHYLVRVPLNNIDARLVPGAVGTAKIRTGSQTVGYRLWRLAIRTFRFEL